MKEELAWGLIALFKLGLIWIVVVVACGFIAFRVQNLATRVLIILAGIVSIPVWVMMSAGLEKLDNQRTLDTNQAIAAKSSDQYRDLCARPQQILVKRAVNVSAPIEIRIQESPRLYRGLGLMQPVSGKTDICWTKSVGKSCANQVVSGIQWEFKSDASWCRGKEPNRDCHLMWKFDVASQQRTEVQAISAPYVIEVFEPKKIDPLIESFDISLREESTGEILAETTIYQKGYFGNINDPSSGSESRYCPDRDVAIGRLLEKAINVSARQ